MTYIKPRNSITDNELSKSPTENAVHDALALKQDVGNYITALTGDVTASGPGSASATIANSSVTNAKMANMSAATIKGNNTGSSASPSDLNAATVTAMLDNFAGDSGSGGVKGLVPAPNSGDAAAGKYLKSDGTWATVPGGLSNPMTTTGDIIIGGASGAATRLGVGSNNQVLKSNGTTVVWGSAPAPTPLVQTVVDLSDSANISVNASLGNVFRVTLGGNRTLSNPTNATDGQMLQFEIKQDGNGSRTLAFDTKFRFSSDLPQPTLSTGANKLDRILFIYRSADDKFDCLAVNKGF